MLSNSSDTPPSISAPRVTLAWRIGSLIASLIVSLLVYFQTLGERADFDDYSYWPDAITRGHPLMNFFHTVHDIFYRPFQQLAIQYTVANGTSIAPLLLTQIFLHGLFAWLVGAALFAVRKSPPEAIVATVFMLISPSAEYAVGGVDCIHQILCSLFGCISIAFFVKAKFLGNPSRRYRTGFLIASVFAFFLSLLSKEAAVTYFLILCYLIFAKTDSVESIQPKLSERFVQLFAYILVTIVWLTMRHHAGGKIQVDGHYAIHFGPNVIVNMVQLGLGAITPDQTQHVYAAAQSRNLPLLAFYALTTLLVIGIIAFPLFKKELRKTQFTLLAVALVASSAVFPLGNISELYTYMAIPFISAAFAIGAIQLWKRYPMPTVIVMIGLAILSVSSTESKIVQLNQYSEYKGNLIRRLDEVAAQLPKGTHFVVYCRLRNDKPLYSVYTTDTFRVLRPAETKLPSVLGRKDITATVISVSEKPQQAMLPGDSGIYVDGWSGDGSIEIEPLK